MEDEILVVYIPSAGDLFDRKEMLLLYKCVKMLSSVINCCRSYILPPPGRFL
jgi:hypothetical protein